MTAAILRNTQLYRWSRFLRSLIFWQAVWFLYFQNVLSATAAILLYAVYDVAATLLEVPSGYMSDQLGRKKTLYRQRDCRSGRFFLGRHWRQFRSFCRRSGSDRYEYGICQRHR
jgi:MFS family permease